MKAFQPSPILLAILSLTISLTARAGDPPCAECAIREENRTRDQFERIVDQVDEISVRTREEDADFRRARDQVLVKIRKKPCPKDDGDFEEEFELDEEFSGDKKIQTALKKKRDRCWDEDREERLAAREGADRAGQLNGFPGHPSMNDMNAMQMSGMGQMGQMNPMQQSPRGGNAAGVLNGVANIVGALAPVGMMGIQAGMYNKYANTMGNAYNNYLSNSLANCQAMIDQGTTLGVPSSQCQSSTWMGNILSAPSNSFMNMNSMMGMSGMSGTSGMNMNFGLSGYAGMNSYSPYGSMSYSPYGSMSYSPYGSMSYSPYSSMNYSMGYSPYTSLGYSSYGMGYSNYGMNYGLGYSGYGGYGGYSLGTNPFIQAF